MLLSVEPSSPIPIYAQIVSQVRAAVASGDVRAGDALPSVRQLATELRVNPNTVAQAYRELEREGITYVQRGQGTFIAEMDAGRKTAEREAAGEALIARMVDEAFRLGLTAAEVLEMVERRVALGALADGAK
ncbi:MAG: GntR family transcriptional regulator [Gemmatimonadetes bacterium]|nr:GntR family transcriptional regulator [Gemmatimonadota bacterium]